MSSLYRTAAVAATADAAAVVQPVRRPTIARELPPLVGARENHAQWRTTSERRRAGARSMKRRHDMSLTQWRRGY